MLNIIIKKLIQRKKECQRGATAVEFAIVILVFLTIVFGIIEFGLLMYNQHVVTNAGREGARTGVVYRDNRLDKEYIRGVVKNYVENHTVTFSEFNWDDENVIKINNLDNDASKCIDSGDRLEVIIEYSYSYLFLPFDKPTPIEARTVMRCE